MQLLHDVRRIFDREGVTFIPSSKLAEHLAEMDSRPWGDWRHGKPITTRAIADRLRPFGVVPVSNGVARGYHRDRFADAWVRYPLPKASSRQDANNDGGELDFSKCQSDFGTDTLKSEETPVKKGLHDALTLQEEGKGTLPPEEAPWMDL